MIDKIQPFHFIPLGSHQPIIERLDYTVARKRICTLFGPFGCGKSLLIDYWLRIRERSVELIQPSQALYIQLRPPPQKGFPMVCMVHSRLWHQIQRLEQPAYLTKLEERSGYNDADIHTYNSRELQSLLLKLIDRANRRNIHAAIIDNAHFLDKVSLEWLMDLRMYYDEKSGFVPRRAIMLVGRSDLPEGKQTLESLARIGEAVPAWKNLQLSMNYLGRAEFIEAFAWIISRNLQATFHQDIDPRERQREVVDLWKRAGGKLGKKDTGETIEQTGARWRAIEELVVDLDETLGPWDGSRPRVITREVLEQVKSRWTPVETSD